MSANYQDVVAFHRKFGVPIAETPTLVDMDLHQFRMRFLTEEHDETVAAAVARDLPGFFDGLLDLVYVAMGTTAVFGLDWDVPFLVYHAGMVQLDTTVMSSVLKYALGDELEAFHGYDFDLVSDYIRRSGGVPYSPGFADQEVLNKCFEAINRAITMAGQAYLHEDLAGIEIAVVQVGYFAMGTAALCGLPWQAGWDEVQRANMSKERALPDGSNSARFSKYDVVKPEGWKAPDHVPILKTCGWTPILLES
jgi:predicted HAD superfamily Cof-like phosphohydrolase